MKQSTHAKETRTVRSRCHEDRQEDGQRLRHLPGGHEAKATAKRKVTESTPRKVVLMGKHHTIHEPNLQWERDDLLDKLWKAEKQAELWKDESKYSYIYHNKKSRRNAKSRHKTAMQEVFFNYIDSLKKRLLSLDEQISPIIDGR